MNAVAAAILNLTVAETMEMSLSIFARLPDDATMPDAEAIAWLLTDWAIETQKGNPQ